MKVARKHYRITCIRNHSLHDATTKIVNSQANVFVLEDLSVLAMQQNHNLAQAIGDASWGEFRRQLEYKAEWTGKEVIIADKWFASSKLCSCCGWKNNNLKLSDRIFKCDSCGLEIDRDYNAAINLANYGATLKLSGGQVCGEGSSTSDYITSLMFSPSMKQKIVQFDNKITI